MKKKGFTLVELIVVISILGLLILLSLGVFVNIRKNVLEGQYKNLVIDAITKAEEYAEDIKTTEVLDISIDFLIKEGYITPDDGKYLYDPRNNSIMNCFIIHVILDGGQYTATLGEKYELEDGTCDDTVIRNQEMEIYCNGEKCKDSWYNEDVILSIKVNSNILDDEAINNSVAEWSSLTGLYLKQEKGETKEIMVASENILDTTFFLELKVDDKMYNFSKQIKIDKEVPFLISKDIKVDYSATQKLEIRASDMNGSGFAGFALTKNSCEVASFSDRAIDISESGNFKLCLKDNAGNMTFSNITIKKVTFDYNDLSSENPRILPVYYLENNANYPLLKPTRPGYDFDVWLDKNNNRIYDFSNLNDGDYLTATWKIEDVEINVDKIDKNTVGVAIENKINMILVLDVSGSMSGTELSNLKTVANNLIDNMSFAAGSTISIVSFSSTATTKLVKGTSASQGKSVINSLSAGGGTSFNNALSKTNTLINNNLLGEENNYVIFVSDGYDGSTLNSSLVNTIKSNVNTIYAIGIGSGADTSTLTKIASDGCYFNSNKGLTSLEEIFTKIQDEIREETTELSQEGLIMLPNLYITSDYPFILYVNDQEYKFPSKDSMSSLLTVIDNVYYLDLAKVDIKYKLNGNLKSINFTYYYN